MRRLPEEVKGFHWQFIMVQFRFCTIRAVIETQLDNRGESLFLLTDRLHCILSRFSWGACTAYWITKIVGFHPFSPFHFTWHWTEKIICSFFTSVMPVRSAKPCITLKISGISLVAPAVHIFFWTSWITKLILCSLSRKPVRELFFFLKKRFEFLVFFVWEKYQDCNHSLRLPASVTLYLTCKVFCKSY